MQRINRRHFLCGGAAFLCAGLVGSPGYALMGRDSGAGDDIRGKVFKGDAPRELWRWSKKGFRYTKSSGRKVTCGICPNRCTLAPGDRSICRSKINRDGELYTLTYGNPCAVHIDPVEKKPLFHYKPRSRAFSLATTGCNFRCLNCQNWEISQSKPQEVRHHDLPPDQAVEAASRAGCESIAYTYSEAITYFEYMLDTARLASEEQIGNLLISNGYINRQPLLELCKVLDAANINLKSFSDDIYRRLNGGRLKPVLNTLQTLHDQGVHLEITTLLVPGYVDDEEIFKQMCSWILEKIGQDNPLHLLRFFPRYKLNRLAPTPVSSIARFRRLALKEGLRYVYIGNVPGHVGTHTYCHHCGQRLIERKGYFIPEFHLIGDRCSFCETPIPGVWG